MVTHSSILAYGKIPWTEEPGRLQSIGSQRFGHNLVTEHKHKHTSYTLACLPSVFRIKIKFSLMESPGPARFGPYLPPSQGSNYSKCHSGPKRGNVPSCLRPLAYVVFSFWNDPPSTHSTQVTPSIPQTSALMTFSQRSFSDPPYP